MLAIRELSDDSDVAHLYLEQATALATQLAAPKDERFTACVRVASGDAHFEGSTLVGGEIFEALSQHADSRVSASVH